LTTPRKRSSAKNAKARNPARAPAPLGRREQNKQEKYDRIRKAAKHLFATKGFHQTTTLEIAEQADIATGTLFLYAKTKEDLLIMVFKDEMIETSRAAFENVPQSAHLLDQVMHVFNAMIAYHSEDVNLAKALISEVTPLSSNHRRTNMDTLLKVIYDGIGKIISDCQQDGKARKNIDLQLVGQTLFGIYYTALIGWLCGLTTKKEFLHRLPIMLSIAIVGIEPTTKLTRSKRVR